MQNALKLEDSAEADVQRRRHHRVDVELDGRFMLSDGSEHACRTLNVSPGGLEIAATVKPRPDEKIIAYIEILGRIEGRAVRVTSRGFALKCAQSDLKRDKIAAQLTWLLNKDALDMIDQRASDRFVAGWENHAAVQTAGAIHPAKIIDFSLKGVAFTCAANLKIGQNFELNGKACVVIRLFDGGYGAAFVGSQ